MSKRILLTGGAGFVGRHLLAGLLQSDPDSEVWIVDDYSTGKPPDRWELRRGRETQDLGWGKRYALGDRIAAVYGDQRQLRRTDRR